MDANEAIDTGDGCQLRSIARHGELVTGCASSLKSLEDSWPDRQVSTR